jgi:hypothetical protein
MENASRLSFVNQGSMTSAKGFLITEALPVLHVQIQSRHEKALIALHSARSFESKFRATAVLSLILRLSWADTTIISAYSELERGTMKYLHCNGLSWKRIKLAMKSNGGRMARD